MLMVFFASVADAAARGEADPRVICAAIASYLVAFSRYLLALLHHYALGSAGFFWIANQFWFFAAALAYLATHWLATSEGRGQNFISFASEAAAAAGTR